MVGEVATARKDDVSKVSRPGLIAWEMIDGMGKVLAFGAKKYSAGNWARGMDWSRPWDALHRHLNAWASGERRDPETGYSHLWHAACSLMFLIAYEARGIGRDDMHEAGVRGQVKARESESGLRDSHRGVSIIQAAE